MVYLGRYDAALVWACVIAAAMIQLSNAAFSRPPSFSPRDRRIIMHPVGLNTNNCQHSKRNQQYSSVTQFHISPEILIGGGVMVAGFAGWLYVDGADDRQRRRLRQEEEERYLQYQEERARQAYIEPKEYWTKEELTQYDGTQDPDGPILLAADGLVFNVYKGRNFYGPGGEYHLFAGRDATRLLAKTIVEEETPKEAAKPLTMAERAALAAWVFTFKGKYEIVGSLEGFDPATTSMKSLGT